MSRLTGADAQAWLARKQAEHEALMAADVIDDGSTPTADPETPQEG